MYPVVFRHAYFDALRGYAILGVLLVHSSQQFPDLALPLRSFAEQGAQGVELFFIVSAATLTYSWQSKGDGAPSFYIRRLFRIVPMFWAAAVFWTLFFKQSALHVALTAVFAFGWHPLTINEVVPGGWSIADEMTFYLVFPVLATLITSARRAAAAFVASLLAAVVLDRVASNYWLSSYDATTVANFTHYWFPNQLPAFLAGMLAWYSSTEWSGRFSARALEWMCAGSIAVIAVMAFAPRVPGSFVFAFALLVFCLASGAGRWLISTPLQMMGRVSYSAYFWHFVLLAFTAQLAMMLSGSTAGFFSFFAVLVVATALVSWVTFRYVELPGIAVGQRLASRAVA